MRLPHTFGAYHGEYVHVYNPKIVITIDSLSPRSPPVDSYDTDLWGGANQASGISNITPMPMKTDGVSASVSATIGDEELLVRHEFKPSNETKNLYQVTVTYENLLATETLTDIRYRRAMDWDIPPSPYSECVSIFFKSPPSALEYATDDGFEGINPLEDVSTSGIDFSCPDGGKGCPVYDSGPKDHGAMFQFLFKDEDGNPIELGPGETFSFEIFYGAADTKKDADEALGAVGAEIATYGYPPAEYGCDASNPGLPNVFMIGFKGVGGTSLGKNVKVDYYEIDEGMPSLPEDGFMSLKPYKSEFVDTIYFPTTSGDFAGSGRSDLVGAVFMGFATLPMDGVYTFCLTSDDGSKLYINEELMIDNDGLHDDVTKCEDIEASPGIVYKMEVQFFEAFGDATLMLSVRLPDSEESIPFPTEYWINEISPPDTDPTASPTSLSTPSPSLSPTKSPTYYPDDDGSFEIISTYPGEKFCVQPEEIDDRSGIIVKYCNGSTIQKWVVDKFGRIKPSQAPALCVTKVAFDRLELDYCGSIEDMNSMFIHNSFEDTILWKKTASMAFTISSYDPKDDDSVILFERDRSLQVQEWKMKY